MSDLISQCRSVSSEVSSDLIVQVKGSRYLLHKVGKVHKFSFTKDLEYRILIVASIPPIHLDYNFSIPDADFCSFLFFPSVCAYRDYALNPLNPHNTK